MRRFALAIASLALASRAGWAGILDDCRCAVPADVENCLAAGGEGWFDPEDGEGTCLLRWSDGEARIFVGLARNHHFDPPLAHCNSPGDSAGLFCEFSPRDVAPPDGTDGGGTVADGTTGGTTEAAADPVCEKAADIPALLTQADFLEEPVTGDRSGRCIDLGQLSVPDGASLILTPPSMPEGERCHPFRKSESCRLRDYDLCVWDVASDLEDSRYTSGCQDRRADAHCHSTNSNNERDAVTMRASASGLMACVTPWQENAVGEWSLRIVTD